MIAVSPEGFREEVTKSVRTWKVRMFCVYSWRPFTQSFVTLIQFTKLYFSLLLWNNKPEDLSPNIGTFPNYTNSIRRMRKKVYLSKLQPYLIKADLSDLKTCQINSTSHLLMLYSHHAAPWLGLNSWVFRESQFSGVFAVDIVRMVRLTVNLLGRCLSVPPVEPLPQFRSVLRLTSLRFSAPHCCHWQHSLFGGDVWGERVISSECNPPTATREQVVCQSASSERTILRCDKHSLTPMTSAPTYIRVWGRSWDLLKVLDSWLI